MTRSFTDEESEIIRAYLDGKLTLNEAEVRFDVAHCLAGKTHRVPVKFSVNGTPYVESSVAVISLDKLAVMVGAALARRRQL